MSINVTTLTGAVGLTDTQIGVASATGITAPVSTTGSGFTYLQVDQELMFVTAVSGTFISVLRGQLGTQATSHLISARVIAGLPSDFNGFVPAQNVSADATPYSNAPIGTDQTGATITPNGSYFRFTGSTALVTITPPAGLVSGGKITIEFQGTSSGLTWTAAGNIAVAGTSTTAASTVEFFYNPVDSKWHPSRLA